MVDQVVSSRFGARPLLDIPAMQVSSGSHQEMPSLQNQVPPLRLDPHTTGLPPRHSEVVPRPYHTAPPPESLHPLPREYDHYYGPHGEVVKPLSYCLPPHEKYPGVHIPYDSSYHHPVSHIPPPLPLPGPPPPHAPLHLPGPPPPHAPLPFPPPPHVHHPPPATVPPYAYPSRRPAVHLEPRPQTFDVTCELDYGRVSHISVRESHGHFRGVPDYLRRELMRTYGRYPFMEVKIRYENGDYHIYANHDKRQQQRQYPRRGRSEQPVRNRYFEEDEDSYEDRRDHRYDNDDDETVTDGIKPREMGAPRGILREEGWSSYR